MNRSLPARASAGDLELLSLLWEHGPSTLAEVHERLDRQVGYTTVQTRLNRLVDKGWADKGKEGRGPTRYVASVAPEQVSASHLDQLVERVAKGSVVPLVTQLLGGASLTADEVSELKQALRDAEKRLVPSKRKGGER